MSGKFLDCEQAQIDAVAAACTQSELKEWFDQSPIKSRFKKDSMRAQGLRCCYCRRFLDSTNNKLWELEHVLCQDGYPQFLTVEGNLAMACEMCNREKGNKDVLIPKPTLGTSLAALPTDHAEYSIPHPRLDDWWACLSHVNHQIYVGINAKGVELLGVCALNKRAVDSAELDYDMVVAAVKKKFFASVGPEIPRTLPDSEVLRRVADFKDGMEDLRRDDQLKSLAKTLESEAIKAKKRLPAKAVKDAKGLRMKREKAAEKKRAKELALAERVLAVDKIIEDISAEPMLYFKVVTVQKSPMSLDVIAPAPLLLTHETSADASDKESPEG